MMAARPAVAVAILACAISAHATSIIILRSPNRVYIGADSRREYRDAHGFYPGSVCKIVPAGRFFFVASGLTYANNQQVADIGADAGRTGHSVLYAIETFRARMQDFLPNALKAESQLQKSFSESRDGLVLESAFIGLENNLASVTVEWYRNSGTPADPRVITDRRTYSSTTPGRYDFIFLGKRHAIDAYISGRRTPRIRGDGDAIALITRLIDLETEESPDTTAPPIDILELDTFGAHWITRKPGCGASYQ